MLQTPYLAECCVSGKTYENVEVLSLNHHTCWINFKPNKPSYDIDAFSLGENPMIGRKSIPLITGDTREAIPIKRHLRKHNVKLSYIDVTR